ncbi:MAG: SDR family NAD(P)-dependent oxidoreductase [Planctomycetota bacterium]
MMRFPSQRLEALRAAFEGRRICVTGGAGFIGAHTVDVLLACGATVSVIDDLSNSMLATLSDHLEMTPERLRFVYGSILDDRALSEAIEGCDRVIHLAAMGSVPRSFEQPTRAFEVNATGTLRVLEAARRAGADRVVLAASSSAYGDPSELPCLETMPNSPMSPYAASKLAAEALCQAWPDGYGLDTVCLRYFNVFGPRQRSDSDYAAVVAAFAKRLLAGEAPVIYGDGQQARDFTYVANAVDATLRAASLGTALGGRIMNIGAGAGGCTIADLARMMGEHLAPDAPAPVFEPARPGDVRDSAADITRARDLLGYEPLVDLQAGLEETCAWFRTAEPEESRP